ncbi:MAG: hypothetical protein JNM57_15865 [Cyclobacteriaceae bacterium]|nr:hypothetical protein [Cyclobacteriaceae bacterium]
MITQQSHNRALICADQNFLKPLLILTIPVLMMAFILTGCEPDQSDDPIPYVPFSDITLNLNLPENIGLISDGGHKLISSSLGGVQGIILYRKNSSAYYAFERNCSYQPAGACVTVEVHSSNLYMIDPCCSSIFSFPEGNPNGGPAWRPLRKYATYLNGSTLTITDEIVE